MRYKGINSLLLAGQTKILLDQNNYAVSNIDVTIIAEKPKLAPYISQMRENLAEVYDIAVSDINIKATTEEGLGFTGRGEGIASHAVVLIVSAD
jgi:2-C-methyl-D-erythritol 2,4-cyclodiphosphate synthase